MIQWGHEDRKPYSTQLANEYVYTLLSAWGSWYADLAQDDADALLALHQVDALAPQATPPDADGATLPPSHPIHQLMREAVWLASHPAFAA